ncbi:DNA polymerase III subunit alpha [Nocardioides limicola]|uniref:DNA polymerase III subunit alpha n=1 Tax=Nocardioides limicola TaxID=2803368 RepID=UPI00193C85DE|nr:DNA polymerase III subunit alpha [Nocardioides sp. DJM-14]
MSDPFVHLHVSSGYSLQYGASHPHLLVERAADLEMDTLALTDRDGLYGAVKFVKACQRSGIRPVLGVDLAYRWPGPEQRLDGRGRSVVAEPRRTPARGGAFRDPRLPRLTLLADGRAGWAALCRLVSAAHAAATERGRPVLDPTLIGEHAAHVRVLLGPDSEPGQHLAARRHDLARVALARLSDLVPRHHLVMETVSHRLPGHGPGSSIHAARMLGLAAEAGVGTVLSNQVRYAARDDAPIIDILDSARRLVPLGSVDLRDPGPTRGRGNAEGYLKSGKEMTEIAEDICRAAGLADAEATRLLARSRSVADQCVLEPADLGMGRAHLPELGVAGDADAMLRAACEASIERRYGAAPRLRIWSRLDHELQIIGQLGYAAYFLTVAEVTDLIRDLGVRCAARGSGAGSLVNHLLGISAVDPLRHDLLMERFCSPLRATLPDIDLDVESARRTEIYDAILARFGSDRCVCVSMRDTYRVRHAVRDVGAAIGLPPTEIDAIAKAFPHIRARDARAALRELPELRNAGLDAGHLDVLLRLVERLDGLPRHIALHPCGVILSDATLLDRTPVEPSHAGYPMSQFDKDDVEDLGLLKLDVLGIRMQSAMAHAIAEVERVDAVTIDLDEVPYDDPATYRLISEARTLGVFQIESPGQRELIAKSGIDTFEDVIVDISLFRPGPVKSDMVRPYLEAKQGWKQAVYPHPQLRGILGPTHGVVVFHEQVIELIATFAGVSHAEADVRRRMLGDVDGMADTRIWFHTRALARGYELALVERMWAVLAAFASFGFCKAHAAAFAVPTFQSAWLKAHHPAAFLAGVLTHDPGMYPKRLILDDARQCGLEVLGLDVNVSGRHYTVERTERGYGIRIALGEVKGISDAEIERVLAGRPYSSLADFWHRARVSRPVAERLVETGALDRLHGITDFLTRRGRPTRRDLLLQINTLDRASRSAGLVGQLALDLDGGEVSHGLPEMAADERLRAELEVLGLDVSTHVLTEYADFLAALGVTRSRDLLGQRSRADLLVAGVKVATQTPPVRSGHRVVFLTLDDATGPVDVTFFSDAQGPYAATVFGSWLLLVRGELRRTGYRGVSLRGTGAWELTELRELARHQGLEAVRRLIESTPAGQPERPEQPRRVLTHTSGFAMSPYSDIRPAGEDVRQVARKLWHRSPGSPG